MPIKILKRLTMKAWKLVQFTSYFWRRQNYVHLRGLLLAFILPQPISLCLCSPVNLIARGTSLANVVESKIIYLQHSCCQICWLFPAVCALILYFVFVLLFHYNLDLHVNWTEMTKNSSKQCCWVILRSEQLCNQPLFYITCSCYKHTITSATLLI